MVSGNSHFTIDSEDSVEFAALTEEEQRVVAERLLRMRESNWKRFWCKDKTCTTGDPHPLKGALGDITYVDANEPSTPERPVANYYENLSTGKKHTSLDPTKVDPNDMLLGRVLLDPGWAHNHARRDQHLPSWRKPWTLFIMSGRGTGKTKTGVEFVTLNARKGLDGAILGRRGTELTNTHVKEILAAAHPDFMPIYWASKDLLEWPNGAVTYLFSGEKPENIRSINISYYWIDEAAFMEHIKVAHMNLKLATRIETAENPKHVLITSTPTPTPWVVEMEDNPDVEVRRVSTYANRANLGVSYLADLVKDLEGTRIGRQELHGEVLRDVEGALWNDDMFRHLKVSDAAEFAALCEEMDDVVVAVDPAGTANKRSDLTGIIAVGVQHHDENGNRLDASRFYVLADGTIKGSPTEWARRVFSVAKVTKARRIVVEKTFGADMVKQVLLDFARLFPEECLNEDGDDMSSTIKEADARQGKETRAEPVVGKYEQGRVTHVPNPTVYGDLSTMEKEQTTWVPRSRGGKSPSPNRIDALVWAVRALEQAVRFATSMAGPSTVRALTEPQVPVSGVVRLNPALNTVIMPEARTAPPTGPLVAPSTPVAVPVRALVSVPETKTWPGKPRVKRPPGVHKR